MVQLKHILIVGVLGIALILGAAAYTVFKTPEAASGPLEAIPITQSAASTSTSAASTQAASAAAGTTATSGSATENDAVVLQIDQANTTANFVIDEVLNDAPKTVIGTTNQVAGEIAIDPQDPSKTQVGVIQVNARTLTTDSDFRNRAIKNQILQTDDYEFITFTPTEVVGLAQAGAVGEPYTFQIVGDLTIKDVTKQVTFDVNATATSPSSIEGTANTTITYADYGISIPQVPQVASVSDQVRLELNFAATTA